METSAKPPTTEKDHPATDNSWTETVAAFESHLYQGGKSEATITSYGSCLSVFHDYYRQHLQKPGPYIDRVQEAELKAFLNFLRYERRLNAATVNRYIVALRSFCNFVFTKGWHRRLLTKDIKSRRIRARSELPRLTRTEVRRLMSTVDLSRRNGHRNLAILQLIAQCGVRVGELIRLSRDDVVLHKNAGRIRIRAYEGEKERIIPLNTAARRALQEYFEAHGDMAGHGPLFVSERQRRLSVQAVQYMIKRHLCLSGRDDLSAQDLRDYFAIGFYSRSRNLTATQQVLGHRDINTTARYAKIVENTLKEDPNDPGE